MFDFKNESENPQLISAEGVMLSIGVLAFVFPILLIVVAAVLENCGLIQNSISAYYHTISRNVFVGSICAIAFCLFAYKGYCQLDNILANIASFFALGVAFFPTSIRKPFTDCLDKVLDNGTVGTLHFISAAALFILLGCFSAFIFTRSKPNTTLSKNKIKRNRIYKVSGYLIFFFILVMTLYFKVFSVKYPEISNYRPVYWLETFCLWSFAISWLTKSGIIYPDPE